MNLVNPGALLLAGLAVPIIALYILKVRLRRAPVTTLLFWRQIFEEKKPRSLWQRLRHWISLALQLLFLSLLVAALADPLFRWQKSQARRLVLVLDNSASMNATDVAPSRFEAARAQGRGMIDGLRLGDEMAIIAAASLPTVVCGMTDHQRTLREALESVAPSDGPTRVSEAIALARRLLAEDTKATGITVLTDGGFEGAAELADQSGIELVLIGKRTPNLGITGLQARRSLLDPIGYEILVEVSNASDDPADCRLELELDGQPIDVVPLQLKPGERTVQMFEKTSAEGGLLRARLNRDDALAVDNSAVALLPRRNRQKVRLETAGNLFLEKVFEAMPLVDLELVKDPAKGPPVSAGLALTVLHRRPLTALPAGPVLIIEPEGPSPLWQAGEKLQNPVVAKLDSESPLLSHVRLDQVLMPEARKLTIASRMTTKVLAESATGDPLYAVVDRPEGKVLVLTVDLDKSDLTLQTAFPIMMTNLLSWLAGTKGELREALAAGSVAELALAPETDPGAVRLLRSPRGVERNLPGQAAKVHLGPLDRAGIWKVVRRLPAAQRKSTGQAGSDASPAGPSEETLREIACNLGDRRETDIRPPEHVEPRPVPALAGFFRRPVWFYLLACAWCLTTWEWYLYQRRWID
jgi:hypothetical protein